MKLNFKGFFKAAGLCSLAFALTGCITWGLVSNTASRPHAEQWRSDTIKGLSLAEDSNGTKGYVFVGESLDYLLTTGGDEVVNMLNDPAIHGERITVSDNAKFILSSSNKNFSGAITLYYDLRILCQSANSVMDAPLRCCLRPTVRRSSSSNGTLSYVLMGINDYQNFLDRLRGEEDVIHAQCVLLN